MSYSPKIFLQRLLTDQEAGPEKHFANQEAGTTDDMFI